VSTVRGQSRVIISATCFADADAAIAMATILARKVKGNLLGLLVEDESILRYADLPFAKVIAFQPGTPQPVTSKTMAAAFQRDAKVFKAILEKTATDASVNWSFESKRGRMMPLLHSVASKGDFILLGHQRSPISSGEIIYLNYADAEKSDFQELAIQVAREMDIPIQVISPLGEDNSTVGTFRNTKEGGSEATFSARREDQLLDYLGNKSLRAVFVAAAPDQELDIHNILEAARCPVVYLVQR
jgi:hypothetical protein